MQDTIISPLLRPNRLPQKGIAIPKFDLESIWEAIKFTPHSGQREIFEGWQIHQTTTAVCGTRFGKSELAAHIGAAYIAPCRKKVFDTDPETGKRFMRYVDHHTRGAIIAPTLELTKVVMDKIHILVLKLCDLLGYPKGKRKKDRYIDDDFDALGDLQQEPGVLTVRQTAGNIREIITPWGNRITAFTMENPGGLLGKAFDYIITDEFGQLTEAGWSDYFEYADRATLDFKGWVYHGTTPKGFNALYDKFFLPGLDGPKRNTDYISFKMPSERNDIIFTPADIEKKRKTTPPRLFAMNYMAQFTVLEGQVYEEFSRETHVRSFKARPEWLYFLAIDFGFTDPFVCLLMAWTGEALVVVDEIHEAGLTTNQQRVKINAMVATHMPPGARWLDGKDGKWTAWCDPRNPQIRADFTASGLPLRKAPTRIKGQRNEIEAGAQIVAEFIHPVEDMPIPDFALRPDNHYLGGTQFYVHERCTETIHSLMSWVKKDSGYDGPDHGCFTAETRVLTHDGWQAIEDIQETQLVLTREGWKPVLAAGMTSASAEIWELTASNGSVLRGTANHPVYVKDRGFVRLDELQEGDELLCQELSPLSTKASPFAAIPTQRAMQTAITTALAHSTSRQACKRFIGKFTEMLVAPFLTAGMFTTEMAIPATTTQPTWNVCPQLPTMNTTLHKQEVCPQGTLKPWRERVKQLRSGIVALKEGLGTLFTPSVLLPPSPLLSMFANSAAKLTPARSLAAGDSAPIPAKANGGVTLEWMMWTKSAFTAEQPSETTNTARVSPVRVVAVAPTGNNAPVYNLTVQDQPEYFAEGILVHNCDAVRYGTLGARRHLLPKSEMLASFRGEVAPRPKNGRIKTRPLESKSGRIDMGVR